MNRIAFFLLLFAGMFSQRLCAQNQDPASFPKPPFIAPMPNNCTWTIKITPNSQLKLPPGARIVTEQVITKAGTSRETVSVWTDGSKSEVWYSGGYRLERTPGHGPIMVTPPNRATDGGNIDFPDLLWLALSNYTDIENLNGQNCYLFKTQVTLREQRVIVNYLAYINVKTKTPVAWDVGPNHFEIVSLEPRDSHEPLVLPPAFADYLKTYRLEAGVVNAYKKQ